MYPRPCQLHVVRCPASNYRATRLLRLLAVNLPCHLRLPLLSPLIPCTCVTLVSIMFILQGWCAVGQVPIRRSASQDQSPTPLPITAATRLDALHLLHTCFTLVSHLSLQVARCRASTCQAMRLPAAASTSLQTATPASTRRVSSGRLSSTCVLPRRQAYRRSSWPTRSAGLEGKGRTDTGKARKTYVTRHGLQNLLRQGKGQNVKGEKRTLECGSYRRGREACLAHLVLSLRLSVYKLSPCCSA